MLFSSALFLFGFVPLFYLAYFAVRRELRNPLLLAASLFFYAWAEPVFIFWAPASALLDYALGAAIHASAAPGRRRWLVAAGCTANVALLAWFKYANFFADALSAGLARLGWGGGIPLAQIALPIAVSFIVFEKITYLVDISRGTGRPAPDVWTYLLYVFYFPKLLAGPIIRYCDIERQLVAREATLADVRDGAVRFLVGLGKKVLIADHVGRLVSEVFKLPDDQLGFGTAWLGVACFTVQIYFDFSGYSDMAIGLSRTLGFRLHENFRMPYTAINFTDFWRRWHISLGTWIREYLYIPLGGNRVSPARTYFNLGFCFFLSGLWHGAAWNFVAWGVFHGVMLMADRLFWTEGQKRLPRLVNVAITLFLVMLSWVIFRAESFAQMGFYLERLFSPWGVARPNLVWCSPDVAFALLVGAILILAPLVPGWPHRAAAWCALRFRHESELAGGLALLLLSVSRLASDTFNPFLYFRF